MSASRPSDRESPPGRVLWAVDIFAEDDLLQRSVARILSSLFGSVPTVVEPVHVFTGLPAGVRGMPTQELLGGVQEEGERRLRRITQGTGLARLEPLQVLSNGSVTHRHEIELLTEYAHRRRAELLALSTHGRKGLKRAFLGSFAETMLFYSDLPLLLVNPHWKDPARLDRILFPTDFSPASDEAYARVLGLAARLSAGITLFHRVPHAIPPALDFAINYSYLSDELFQDAITKANQDADRWAERGRRVGVRVDPIVDTSLQGTIPDGILQQAEKAAGGLIAMAAHSGPYRLALLGSVARRVIREAPLPVWLIRSHDARVERAFPEAAA